MPWSHDARWEQRTVSADDVVARLKNGSNVFVHGACATPTPLLDALCRRTDLHDVRLWHLHLGGPVPFAAKEHSARLRSTSLFTTPALRDAIAEGRADFVPVFLSDIPYLFQSGHVQLDAALLQLSPPDAHGNCSLGTSVDAARAASIAAPLLLAEINERMPRTHGDTAVPFERIAAFVKTDRPLAEHPREPETPVYAAIGDQVAKLVADGATLQLGIGAIPDAVLARLKDKHDLGLHTEMFSDGVIDLVEGGVITNRKKKTFQPVEKVGRHSRGCEAPGLRRTYSRCLSTDIRRMSSSPRRFSLALGARPTCSTGCYPGRCLTSFVSGSQRLFDFVADNPQVEFQPCDLTNDPAHIRKNDSVVAINSALQIDLTGQVCADSFGHRIYSGIGGQIDFMRGAALSKGGKPIVALPSTAKGGQISRIVAELTPGAGVVTTRGHVHYVVTEYGAVNLFGTTLRERAERLIALAHPDFRAELMRDWRRLAPPC